MERLPSCFRSTIFAFAPFSTASTRRGGSPQRKPNGGNNSFIATTGVVAARKRNRPATNRQVIRWQNCRRYTGERAAGAWHQVLPAAADRARISRALLGRERSRRRRDQTTAPSRAGLRARVDQHARR